MRAVAADDVQLVDAALAQELDRALDVEAAARRSEHRAAVMVDRLDDLRREHDRRELVVGRRGGSAQTRRPAAAADVIGSRGESAVAAANAPDLPHAVVVVQRVDEVVDDVVQARAQAAARDDRRAHVGRLEVQLAARPRAMERARFGRGVLSADDVDEHAVMLLDDLRVHLPGARLDYRAPDEVGRRRDLRARKAQIVQVLERVQLHVGHGDVRDRHEVHLGRVIELITPRRARARDHDGRAARAGAQPDSEHGIRQISRSQGGFTCG